MVEQQDMSLEAPVDIVDDSSSSSSSSSSRSSSNDDSSSTDSSDSSFALAVPPDGSVFDCIQQVLCLDIRSLHRGRGQVRARKAMLGVRSCG